jgi:hypothetical protein
MAEIQIRLSSIRLDGGTQPRAATDPDLVGQYADALVNGAKFPPLVLYHDGSDYWLADGFHRYHAMDGCGLTSVPCEVRQGTRRDAILFSVGANAAHGLRRTNEDKRRAVLRLLDDPEWSGWSDREIARTCQVSPDLVGKLRPAGKVTVGADSEARSYTTKHGTPAVMNTSRIGQREPGKFPAPSVPTETRAAPLPDLGIADQLADLARVVASVSAFDAMRHIPPSKYGTFSSDKIRDLGMWLLDLADAWDATMGVQPALAPKEHAHA